MSGGRESTAREVDMVGGSQDEHTLTVYRKRREVKYIIHVHEGCEPPYMLVGSTCL